LFKSFQALKTRKLSVFLNYFVQSVVIILISHTFFRVLFTGPIIVVHNQNARGKKNNFESFFSESLTQLYQGPLLQRTFYKVLSMK